MSKRNITLIAIALLGIGLVAVIIRLSLPANQDPLNLPSLPEPETSATTTQETNNPTQPMEETNNTTKLEINDTKVGTGAEAKAGQKVTVHYVGTLLDGSKFDSSRDRGTPFTFGLGAGQVIQGWDLGVAGMKVGGIRTLIIPSELAYGDNSPSPAIPAGSTLKFEVELLGVE